jgi:undecaprenyl-diphosphatase
VPVTVRPTGADIAIANAITRNTKPAPEAIARALTWGADEKVLLALAAAGWLASRGRSDVLRRAGNHALFVTIAASLLPHGTLPARPRRAIQTVAVGLSLTRILVLAHWASDVVAGFALGALLERLLRLRTGYPLERSKEDDHANS